MHLLFGRWSATRHAFIQCVQRRNICTFFFFFFFFFVGFIWALSCGIYFMQQMQKEYEFYYLKASSFCSCGNHRVWNKKCMQHGRAWGTHTHVVTGYLRALCEWSRVKSVRIDCNGMPRAQTCTCAHTHTLDANICVYDRATSKQKQKEHFIYFFAGVPLFRFASNDCL